MMRKLHLLFMFLFISAYGYSQTLHSSAKILKLMSASKLSFNVIPFDKPVVSKDYSDRVNINYVYRVLTPSGFEPHQFIPNKNAQSSFDKSEAFFKDGNIVSAMLWYKMTLSLDSSLFHVITYIGQLYEKKNDYDNAILWYKKAISKNYIDYMAHWFLADAYMTRNDTKNAVDEIVIARILNRNHPRIKESMSRIFDKDKRNKEDWNFNPQVNITKISDTKINISFDQSWSGYAMAKALWTYEPGYRESMGVPKGKYSIVEDFECLTTMVLEQDIEKTKSDNDPQLSILQKVAYTEKLPEYILYEIVLPQTPNVVYQLSEETILKIKDYVLNKRNTK